MKRSLFAVVIAVCAVMLISSVAVAGIATDKFAGQGIVTLKHTYTFGNVNLTPKCVGFFENEFNQYWMHVQVDMNGSIRPFVGMLINWHGQQNIGYYGLKLQSSSDEKLQLMGEIYKICYDGDFFSWGAVEYHFKDGNDTYIGYHVEVANRGQTDAQAGPHVGIDNFEVGVYLGKTSAVRASYTLKF